MKQKVRVNKSAKVSSMSTSEKIDGLFDGATARSELEKMIDEFCRDTMDNLSEGEKENTNVKFEGVFVTRHP